jgi:RimJ/RimL family protein N-acetyltransferase
MPGAAMRIPENTYGNESEKIMVELKKLTEDEKQVIYNWPVYPEDCIDLDYAVRKGGWLDIFPNNETNTIFSAYSGNELIGFSGFHRIDNDRGDFIIALRGDALGRGFGKEITSKILNKCFRDYGFKKIGLVVRKNNTRAISLYRKIGFACTGECVINIRGKDADFYKMEIDENTLVPIKQ